MHITQQTLELLEDQYFFEPGTEMAKKDPVLIKNNIETFLISPQFYFGSDSQVSVCCYRCCYACNHCKFHLFTYLSHCCHIVRIQYYSPDELNRRYEKTSSIGSKRVVSRTVRNNVIFIYKYYSFIIIKICPRKRKELVYKLSQI